MLRAVDKAHPLHLSPRPHTDTENAARSNRTFKPSIGAREPAEVPSPSLSRLLGKLPADTGPCRAGSGCPAAGHELLGWPNIQSNPRRRGRARPRDLSLRPTGPTAGRSPGLRDHRTQRRLPGPRAPGPGPLWGRHRLHADPQCCLLCLILSLRHSMSTTVQGTCGPFIICGVCGPLSRQPPALSSHVSA